MKFIEILSMALASLKANKLRSGLTMLGIIIGVFSIIGVMTVIGAIQSSIELGLMDLGTNTFQIQKYPAINNNRRDAKYANRKNIDYQNATVFRRLMSASPANIGFELWDFAKSASYRDLKTDPNVQICGGDENFFPNNGYYIDYGRSLTEQDVEYSRNVVVLGSDLATTLFPHENPLGKEMRLGGAAYTVIGVLESKGGAFGQSRDYFTVIPITKFMENYGASNRSINITVQAGSQEVYKTIYEQSVGYMRMARGLKAEQDNDFETFSNESLITTFNQISSIVATGALVISAIALFAAGIGIMNIMLVSVTERTKEIGVRKAIGAKKISILTQFLIEAIVLCELGGLVGIIIGAGVGNILALQLNTPVQFPFFWACIGVVSCSAIGIGFGIYPAYKAAGLDPIEALRFE
jgi:putative ABC transport system permease protein